MGRWQSFLVAGVLLGSGALVFGGNIDPDNEGARYAYAENSGWINFKPGAGTGVTVSAQSVLGYAWAENIGWINLAPTYGGVVNDGTGQLSGYAWGENVGWINFNPQAPDNDGYYGVSIDAQGSFSGWAWGENIGWIHFQSTAPVAYQVKVCIVSLEDFARLSASWLAIGPGLAADLNHNGAVNLGDFAILEGLWWDYCSEGWSL